MPDGAVADVELEETANLFRSLAFRGTHIPDEFIARVTPDMVSVGRTRPAGGRVRFVRMLSDDKLQHALTAAQVRIIEKSAIRRGTGADAQHGQRKVHLDYTREAGAAEQWRR
jgi:hypothetical protein